MVRMKSIVTFTNPDGGQQLIFRNQVHEILIESSWKKLSQTATVKLPRFQKLVDQLEKNYKIGVGHQVKIELGYDDTMITEFEGYVSSRGFNSPLEFMCEDEMWKLKQKTVTKYWPEAKLKDVLLYLIPDAQIDKVQDITFTAFRLDRVTVAKALEKLKDEYGLVVYYRGKKLFCGLAYTETGLGEVQYHFQKNVPQNESKLEYKESSDVKIRVKAISIYPNNKHIEHELGDTTGDASETTLHFFNLTKDQLIKQAEEKIKLLKYTGWRGSLKAFGFPWTTHGMVANLMNDKYPERTGKYFIDGVRTTYNSSGFRRENELGLRFTTAA